MNCSIYYKDRKTKEIEEEKVYGMYFISLLYGKKRLSKFCYKVLLPLFYKNAWLSNIYGCFQKMPLSKRKVKPFIEHFCVDSSEFAKKSFSSFNDFFIRKLKKEARPISKNLCMPADGRYLVFPSISNAKGFFIKGTKFDLKKLLASDELYQRYKDGSMVIARLCPTDYHRYHFPCDCTPGAPKLINGYLYSVNPIALRKNIEILQQNKRVITSLQSNDYGQIQYLEIGATHVGSIKNTFTPDKSYQKGDEKGYFEFGGSCLVLLFEKDKITFDEDLLAASAHHMETKAQMGDSLGIKK